MVSDLLIIGLSVSFFKGFTKKPIFLMSRLFRLITTRECRVLTLMGWGAILMVFCLVMASTTLFVYPFLSPHLTSIFYLTIFQIVG